jgi:TonB family protein
VSVDGKGELAELFILRSSGLPAYDDEALRTVRSSAPFSSPPEKFLKDNGVLRMSWTFVIYI